jgi:hypothetical protein
MHTDALVLKLRKFHHIVATLCKILSQGSSLGSQGCTFLVEIVFVPLVVLLPCGLQS